MDVPSLPKYPLPEERTDPADRRIDWPLVAGRLLIRGLVIGFLMMIHLPVVVYLTGGQILWFLFGWGD